MTRVGDGAPQVKRQPPSLHRSGAAGIRLSTYRAALFSRRRAMNAPIPAVMIDGIESTANATMPSGSRFPGPYDSSIQTN
jgi:hypothetical protein